MAYIGNQPNLQNLVYSGITSADITDFTITNFDISPTAAIDVAKLSANTVTIGSNTVTLGTNSNSIVGLVRLSANTVLANNVDLGAYSTASYAQANAGVLLAQAAFNAQNSTATIANTKFNSSGGTITGSVTINTDLSVGGNVYISGNTTTLNSVDMNVADPLIYMAQGNPSNLNDIGLVGHFTSDHYQHTGIVRDHTDSTWKFFSNVSTEPSTTVNFSEANTIYDSIKVGGLTLSNGTTNGVAYLNASKILTTGSALTFDGTNLGMANSAAVIIGGNVSLYGDALQTVIRGRTTNGTIFQDSTGSEQMRLTSTGLGIGTTSPLGKLDVRSTNGVIGTMNTSTAAVNNTAQITLAPATAFTGAWATGPAVKGLLENASTFATSITINPYNGSTGQFEAARFDSSGNLGLGVTPSGWSSAFKAVELSGGSLNGNSGNMGLSQNAYRGASSWTYTTTTAATLYQTSGGQHYWFNAPSGTAGNAISWTQAMTLDVSGRLLVGATSASSVGNATVAAVGSAVYDGQYSIIAQFSNDTTSAGKGVLLGFNNTSNTGIISPGYGNGTQALAFWTHNGTAWGERMRLDASGNMGIATTSPQFRFVVAQNNAAAAGSLQVSPTINTRGYAGASKYHGGIAFSMHEHTNGYWGSAILSYDDTGSYGSALTFYTSTGSATPSPTERMRLDSSGVLSLSQGQIKFPTSQVASADANTLDDYEEGSWTPRLTGTGGGVYTMGGINAGRYTKVGNLVTVSANIQWTAVTTAYSGNLFIADLPFTAASIRSAGTIGAVSSGISFSTGNSYWVLVIDPGNAGVYIIQNSSTGTGYTHNAPVASSGIIYGFQISYFTS